MEKIMPLELLSSIRGAKSSEAVEQLFEVIRKAVPEHSGDSGREVRESRLVAPESLRADEVRHSSEMEKDLIHKNFPREKNGYLVVPKVIDE